jgi:hypothetical protein
MFCEVRLERLTGSQMRALIRAIHAELKGAYGSPAGFENCAPEGFRPARNELNGGCATTAFTPATSGATR